MTQQQAELLESAQRGDRDALEQLVKDNTGLVKTVAVRFTGRSVEFEDLCQIGHIGMIKAIKNFDLSRGTEFSTYAVPLIMGEIKRYLRDDGCIKVGRELKRKNAAVLRAREEYLTENGCEPTVSVLCRMLDMTSEEITECISASGSAISLSEQSGGLSIEETIGRDFVPETDEKIALKQAIDCLDDEEKKLIMLRYYGNLSQKETGLRLGMTQVTVSRREAVILRKMAKLLGE